MPATEQLPDQQHPPSKTLDRTLDSTPASPINCLELQEELDRHTERHRRTHDTILQLRAECRFGDVLAEIEQLGTKPMQWPI